MAFTGAGGQCQCCSGQGKARRALGAGQGVLPAPSRPQGGHKPGPRVPPQGGERPVGTWGRALPGTHGGDTRVRSATPLLAPREPLAPSRPRGASDTSQNSLSGGI